MQGKNNKKQPQASWEEFDCDLHWNSLLLCILTLIHYYIWQPAWDVSERSHSDLHWDRYLRDLSEASQKRCLFCDVFKRSQIHLKKYVFFVTSLRGLKYISKKMSFFVTSLRRLEHISKRMFFPWRLWDVSKTSLASIFGFSKIRHKNDFVWFP